MRQDGEFFEDRPMTLIFIGKRLGEAKAVEEVLTSAGIDYAVEVDYYTGGVIFRRERAGAFFYVEDASVEPAQAALQDKGYKTLESASGGDREIASQ